MQTFELTTNDFGSVNGQFQLAEGAMLGNYIIEADIGDQSFRQNFKVQDYHKPEIKVEINTNAEIYVSGDPLTITVQADYFFGKPVPDAKITIRHYHIVKPYCAWWSNCSDELQWYNNSEMSLLKGTTDAQGQAQLSSLALYDKGNSYWYDVDDEDSWYGNTHSHTWGLEVTIEDGSGQTVSGYTTIKVYNTTEKLKFDIGKNGLKLTGKPFTATARVVTINDEPVADRELTLSLLQWNEKTWKYDSDVITPTQVTTNADGFAEVTITPPKSGYYKLSLQGTDSRGNELSYNRYIYAYYSGDNWSSNLDRDEITISADQTEVKPYDTVQLLIESTFDGPALLTFERGRVNRVKPIKLTPPLTIVEMDVIPEDAPNIFVTVNAWQPTRRYPETEEEEYWYWDLSQGDSILRRARIELTVDAGDKALDVVIASDQGIYTPRQTATFTMTVTDYLSQPVEAELSLALVDEAIYALSDELAKPIFEHFYGFRPLSVFTYNSMEPYRLLHVPERGGGGGGGDGGLGNNPRADFPDTAFWLPNITTDKNGVATVMVDLPDNLTTWRVVVRAHTKTTRVGETTYNITTQQPVVVRPLLPRVLTEGDQVSLSAFIHNYTETPLDLFASIQISDTSLTISGTNLIPISLAPGEVTSVTWQAEALAPGAPLVTFTTFEMPLVGDGQVSWTVGDAVQLPLAIQPLAVPEIAVETGTFSGEYNAIIPLPPSTLGLSTIRLELSRTVAGSLLEGL